MTERYELDVDRVLPILAEFDTGDVMVRVLQEVEAAYEWIVTWTDGINTWIESFTQPEYAFAWMAAVLRAIQHEVFLVPHWQRPDGTCVGVTELMDHYLAAAVQSR